MTRSCRLAIGWFLAWVPLLAVAAAGQATAEHIGRESWTGGGLCTEYSGTDLRRAFAVVTAALDLEMEVAGRVEGPFVVDVCGVDWRTALTGACEQLGCRWDLEGRRLRVYGDPDAAETARGRGVDLRGVAAELALRRFAGDAGLELALRGRLGAGNAWVRMPGVSQRTALDLLCQSVGCTWDVVGSRLEVEARPWLPPASERLRGSIRMEVVLRTDLETAFRQVVTALRLQGPRFEGSIPRSHLAPTSIVDRGDRVLDRLCREVRCAWRLEETHSGAEVVISTSAVSARGGDVGRRRTRGESR